MAEPVYPNRITLTFFLDEDHAPQFALSHEMVMRKGVDPNFQRYWMTFLEGLIAKMQTSHRDFHKYGVEMKAATTVREQMNQALRDGEEEARSNPQDGYAAENVVAFKSRRDLGCGGNK